MDTHIAKKDDSLSSFEKINNSQEQIRNNSEMGIQKHQNNYSDSEITNLKEAYFMASGKALEQWNDTGGSIISRGGMLLQANSNLGQYSFSGYRQNGSNGVKLDKVVARSYLINALIKEQETQPKQQAGVDESNIKSINDEKQYKKITDIRKNLSEQNRKVGGSKSVHNLNSIIKEKIFGEVGNQNHDEKKEKINEQKTNLTEVRQAVSNERNKNVNKSSELKNMKGMNSNQQFQQTSSHSKTQSQPFSQNMRRLNNSSSTNQANLSYSQQLKLKQMKSEITLNPLLVNKNMQVKEQTSFRNQASSEQINPHNSSNLIFDQELQKKYSLNQSTLASHLDQKQGKLQFEVSFNNNSSIHSRIPNQKLTSQQLSNKQPLQTDSNSRSSIKLDQFINQSIRPKSNRFLEANNSSHHNALRSPESLAQNQSLYSTEGGSKSNGDSSFRKIQNMQFYYQKKQSAGNILELSQNEDFPIKIPEWMIKEKYVSGMDKQGNLLPINKVANAYFIQPTSNNKRRFSNQESMNISVENKNQINYPPFISPKTYHLPKSKMELSADSSFLKLNLLNNNHTQFFPSQNRLLSPNHSSSSSFLLPELLNKHSSDSIVHQKLQDISIITTPPPLRDTLTKKQQLPSIMLSQIEIPSEEQSSIERENRQVNQDNQIHLFVKQDNPKPKENQILIKQEDEEIMTLQQPSIPIEQQKLISERTNQNNLAPSSNKKEDEANCNTEQNDVRAEQVSKVDEVAAKQDTANNLIQINSQAIININKNSNKDGQLNVEDPKQVENEQQSDKLLSNLSNENENHKIIQDEEEDKEKDSILNKKEGEVQKKNQQKLAGNDENNNSETQQNNEKSDHKLLDSNLSSEKTKEKENNDKQNDFKAEAGISSSEMAEQTRLDVNPTKRKKSEDKDQYQQDIEIIKKSQILLSVSLIDSSLKDLNDQRDINFNYSNSMTTVLEKSEIASQASLSNVNDLPQFNREESWESNIQNTNKGKPNPLCTSLAHINSNILSPSQLQQILSPYQDKKVNKFHFQKSAQELNRDQLPIIEIKQEQVEEENHKDNEQQYSDNEGPIEFKQNTNINNLQLSQDQNIATECLPNNQSNKEEASQKSHNEEFSSHSNLKTNKLPIPLFLSQNHEFPQNNLNIPEEEKSQSLNDCLPLGDRSDNIQLGSPPPSNKGNKFEQNVSPMLLSFAIPSTDSQFQEDTQNYNTQNPFKFEKSSPLSNILQNSEVSPIPQLTDQIFPLYSQVSFGLNENRKESIISNFTFQQESDHNKQDEFFTSSKEMPFQEDDESKYKLISLEVPQLQEKNYLNSQKEQQNNEMIIKIVPPDNINHTSNQSLSKQGSFDLKQQQSSEAELDNHNHNGFSKVSLSDSIVFMKNDSQLSITSKQGTSNQQESANNENINLNSQVHSEQKISSVNPHPKKLCREVRSNEGSFYRKKLQEVEIKNQSLSPLSQNSAFPESNQFEDNITSSIRSRQATHSPLPGNYFGNLHDDSSLPSLGQRRNSFLKFSNLKQAKKEGRFFSKFNFQPPSGILEPGDPLYLSIYGQETDHTDNIGAYCNFKKQQPSPNQLQISDTNSPFEMGYQNVMKMQFKNLVNQVNESQHLAFEEVYEDQRKQDNTFQKNVKTLFRKIHQYFKTKFHYENNNDSSAKKMKSSDSSLNQKSNGEHQSKDEEIEPENKQRNKQMNVLSKSDFQKLNEKLLKSDKTSLFGKLVANKLDETKVIEKEGVQAEGRMRRDSNKRQSKKFVIQVNPPTEEQQQQPKIKLDFESIKKNNVCTYEFVISQDPEKNDYGSSQYDENQQKNLDSPKKYSLETSFSLKRISIPNNQSFSLYEDKQKSNQKQFDFINTSLDSWDGDILSQSIIGQIYTQNSGKGSFKAVQLTPNEAKLRKLNESFGSFGIGRPKQINGVNDSIVLDQKMRSTLKFLNHNSWKFVKNYQISYLEKQIDKRFLAKVSKLPQFISNLKDRVDPTNRCKFETNILPQTNEIFIYYEKKSLVIKNLHIIAELQVQEEKKKEIRRVSGVKINSEKQRADQINVMEHQFAWELVTEKFLDQKRKQIEESNSSDNDDESSSNNSINSDGEQSIQFSDQDKEISDKTLYNYDDEDYEGNRAHFQLIFGYLEPNIISQSSNMFTQLNESIVPVLSGIEGEQIFQILKTKQRHPKNVNEYKKEQEMKFRTIELMIDHFDELSIKTNIMNLQKDYNHLLEGDFYDDLRIDHEFYKKEFIKIQQQQIHRFQALQNKKNNTQSQTASQLIKSTKDKSPKNTQSIANFEPSKQTGAYPNPLQFLQPQNSIYSPIVHSLNATQSPTLPISGTLHHSQFQKISNILPDLPPLNGNNTSSPNLIAPSTGRFSQSIQKLQISSGNSKNSIADQEDLIKNKISKYPEQQFAGSNYNKALSLQSQHSTFNQSESLQNRVISNFLPFQDDIYYHHNQFMYSFIFLKQDGTTMASQSQESAKQNAQRANDYFFQKTGTTQSEDHQLSAPNMIYKRDSSKFRKRSIFNKNDPPQLQTQNHTIIRHLSISQQTPLISPVNQNNQQMNSKTKAQTHQILSKSSSIHETTPKSGTLKRQQTSLLTMNSLVPTQNNAYLSASPYQTLTYSRSLDPSSFQNQRSIFNTSSNSQTSEQQKKQQQSFDKKEQASITNINNMISNLTVNKDLEKSISMDRQNLVMRTRLHQTLKRNQLEQKDQVFSAIKENNLHEIEDLLNQYHSLSLESRDEEGNTFLIVASQVGSKEIVEYLLHKGAQINSQNNEGDSALHKANYYQYHSVADLLIQNGAQQNKLNNNGMNPWGTFPSGTQL